MPRAADFYAEDNEPIRPKLRALASFISTEWEKLQIAGPGVRMHQEPGRGRAIVVDPESAEFRGAFFASLRGDSGAVCARGTVNGLVPTIGGVTLDGLDPATGKPHRAGVPVVQLTGAGPVTSGLSWLALSLRVDEATAELAIESDEDPLTVRHLTRLSRTLPGDPLTGLWPISEVVWDATGRRAIRLRQILYFDQRHLWIPGANNQAARHEWGPDA